jgi:hypothetical protein
MNIWKIIGAAVGLTASFFTLCFMAFGILVSAHEPGRFSAVQWVIGVLIVSLPFWATFLVVYFCFCTDKMPVLEICGFAVRPKALLRALLAELGVCAAVIAFGLFMLSLN